MINFICPQINDYYNGFEFKQPYLIKIYSLIENNFEDYIRVLKYLLDTIDDNPLYKLIITKKRLSMGWDRQIINKIYEQL